MRRGEDSTDRFDLADSNLVGIKTSTSLLPYLFSRIKQEGTESVEVAGVFTEEAACRQVYSHLIPSFQLQGHDYTGTVLLVVLISLAGSAHRLAVDLQVGAGSQGPVERTGVTVDGHGDAVHTRAGNSKDASVRPVAVTQVEQDMFIDDVGVYSERAKALKKDIIEESDREGSAAGWRYKKGEQETS